MRRRIHACDVRRERGAHVRASQSESARVRESIWNGSRHVEGERFTGESGLSRARGEGVGTGGGRRARVSDRELSEIGGTRGPRAWEARSLSCLLLVFQKVAPKWCVSVLAVFIRVFAVLVAAD